MTLMERVSGDIMQAMKKGEKVRLETLRMIRAALLEKQVEKRPESVVTPDDEIAVLLSSAKKRKEAIDIYRASGRNDLAGVEEEELRIIQSFLPAQLSAAEIEDTVRNVIAAMNATSAKDFGKVMATVIKELKGKADGKLVQEVVRRFLGASL